jgi:ABC-type transport system substrate-binding protein
VVKNPDAQLIAMQTEEGVALTDLIRTGDIEKLDTDGFTIMSSPGFHMGHIGYNLRTDRDYLTPPYQCNPDAAEALSDVWFRKACFHLYNQEEIVASIYGYTVDPIQSLVANAQGGWVNPEVEKPAFSTTLAQQVLEDHDYTYDSGIGNWRMPGGDPVPPMALWTPTYEVAPTSAEHGARFVQELNDFGLTSIEHVPREFDPYMSDVDYGDFDIYMVFWSLGRFPDHLETMCHSDHDVAVHPEDYNKPGCHDTDLDTAVRTIITSLDHEEKLAAAYLAQELLYDETHPDCAFSYMQLYSRIYFEAWNPDLQGIVNSPGYGSHNGWTELNMRWQPGAERYEGGDTIIEWLWGEEPELLNPCSGSTVYCWDILDPNYDGLLSVNPYIYEDMPWIANDWDVAVIFDGGGPGEDWMNVIFWLNNTVTWADGETFNADDVEFNWNFFKDWLVPRYLGMTMWLEDVQTYVDDYKISAILNTTSQFLLYDLAGTAALLPPQVWDRTWTDLNAIMEYNPTEAYTGPGSGVPTNLFGTGPFIFQYYNPTLMVSDLYANRNYWKTTNEVAAQKTEMFHEIGDVNRDGYIDVFDLSALGVAYGKRIGWPGYNPDADLNSDGICDGRDLALITWHWGEQKEYPVP